MIFLQKRVTSQTNLKKNQPIAEFGDRVVRIFRKVPGSVNTSFRVEQNIEIQVNLLQVRPDRLDLFSCPSIV